MKEGTARLLRGVTFAAFAAVLVVGAIVGWRTLNPAPAVRTPDISGGEMSVATAIERAGEGVLTVRGYVFDGPGGLGLRLCEGIRPGSPPGCFGPFLDLDRVDRGFFALEEGQTDDGPVRWTPEPVALRGTVIGTRMTVEHVLR